MHSRLKIVIKKSKLDFLTYWPITHKIRCNLDHAWNI